MKRTVEAKSTARNIRLVGDGEIKVGNLTLADGSIAPYTRNLHVLVLTCRYILIL